MRQVLAVGLAMLVLSMTPANATSAAPTPEAFRQAIEKGKAYLLSRQQPDGQNRWPAYALFRLKHYPPYQPYDSTLTTLGVELGLRPGTTRTVSLHVLALTYACPRFSAEENEGKKIERAVKADLQWLVKAQGGHGGWGDRPLGGGDGPWDLASTALALQALSMAGRFEVTIPPAVWQRAERLLMAAQQADGAWNDGDLSASGAGGTPRGAATAAALAALGITQGQVAREPPDSPRGAADTTQRIDRAVAWIGRAFTLDADPGAPATPAAPAAQKFFWLLQAERAALVWGIKRYGDHDWWQEGLNHLLKTQAADGSWGDIQSTYYALLFLAEGHPPVLFSKLRFAGDWNSHPRDIANLTSYASHILECEGNVEMFWQVVDLAEPLKGLHDAPVLVIDATSRPAFSDADAKKLRAFTDTGGTILLVGPGKATVPDTWLDDFAQRVWPEWPMRLLAKDHVLFLERFQFRGDRPNIMGIDDGLRTLVFAVDADAARIWQDYEVECGENLFKLAPNLQYYATNTSPFIYRPRPPAVRPPPAALEKAGPPTTLKLARLKYDGGDWTVGRQYRGFERVITAVKERAGMTLAVDESGVAAAGLAGHDVAYLAASPGMAVSEADRTALKQYVSGGGRLWIEAVAGRTDTDAAVKKLAADAGWELRTLPGTDPVVTGEMDKAVGYRLMAQTDKPGRPVFPRPFAFSRSLRVERLGRPYAELAGVYQGDRLVGLYSPFDVVFSTTGYPACGCRGYESEAAEEVATNLLLYLSDRP